jgi:hypothetical protein
MPLRARSVSSHQAVIVSRLRVIVRTIFETPAVPNSIDGIRDMRLATLLAHFRKFILALKYKVFCNGVIHGLQFEARGHDRRQRCLVIENPARVIIKRRAGDVVIGQSDRACCRSFRIHFAMDSVDCGTRFEANRHPKRENRREER